MARAIPDCRTCGGTGWQWLMSSWFLADGLRRERCGICAGTGKSAYRGGDPQFVRRQAEWRDHGKELIAFARLARVKGEDK